MFNQYFLTARLMPAMISSAPLVLLYTVFLRERFGVFLGAFLGIPWLGPWMGDISTGAALIFLWVMVVRTVSKDIFERRWFRSDQTRMPTTEFLLHSNAEYSDEYKDKIREKISTEFGIQFPTAEQEAMNNEKARKRVAEAVSFARKKIKNGSLLLQHNIEYGFMRNLIGGSLVAFLISGFNIWLFGKYGMPVYAKTAMVMLIAYLLPLLLGKPLMLVHGRRYARALFEEYLSD